MKQLSQIFYDQDFDILSFGSIYMYRVSKKKLSLVEIGSGKYN